MPVADMTATSTTMVGPGRQTQNPYRIVMLTQMKWKGTVSQVGTSCIATRLAAAKTPHATLSHSPRPPGRRSGRVEAIALSSHGDDRLRAELLPQAGHVDVDHVRARVELVAPDRRQEVLLGDGLSRVADQLPQQQELALRERDGPGAVVDLPAHQVDPQAADLERPGAEPGRADAHPHALQQLVEAERLGHVVVRAE